MPATSKCRAGLLQEEAIGASQLQQLSAGAIAANELDAAGEFAAQHRLGAEIIGVAVGVAAGEIIPGVVGRGIEPRRFRASEPAIPALHDVAAVTLEAKHMLAHAVARRACPLDFRHFLRRRDGNLR